MLNVSQELKDKVTTLDFKKEAKIIVSNDGGTGDNELTHTNGLVSFKLHSDIFQNGSTLGSVTEKSIEIEVVGEQRALFETNQDIWVRVEMDYYLNETDKETIELTPYMQIDKNSIVYSGTNRLLSVKAFDDMRKFKREIRPSDVFSGSLLFAVQHIANSCDVGFEESGSDFEFLSELSLSEQDVIVDMARYHGKTYLDVLSDIAEFMGCSFVIRRDSYWEDILYAVRLKSTNIYPIHKNSYWDIKTTPNNMKVHGVNTVVLSLAENVDGENVTVQNGNELTDGVISMNIYDNQILWNNDLKETFKTGVANRILNYRYTPFEMQYIGYPFLEVGDRVSFYAREEVYNNILGIYEIQDVEYNGYIHSLEFVYDGGTNSTIKAFPFENAVEKRMNTNPIKEAIKRTELYVDKELGIIQSVVADEVEGLSSLINQTADGIRQEVSENYVSTDELGSYKNEVSTQFTQTTDQFNFDFNNLQTEISDLEGDTQAQFIEIEKYIRFKDGNIELGDSTSQIKLVLENDIIKFVQNGMPVAYIDNNTLYITDGIFLTSLRIGNFEFKPRTNGNLSFGKVV